MSIEIPADWPNRTWVESPPLAHLETLANDAPSGTVPTRWKVASWESTREITSPALPGQVRHKTGLSVGSGRALIKRQPDDFPWKQRDVYRLTGSSAQLLIAPEGSTEIPTGQFLVAEADGDLTTIGVQVELDERTASGRNKIANIRGSSIRYLLSSASSPAFDPVYLVSQLARQMGYGIGPVPGEGGYAPIMDVPFQGSISPAYPRDIRHLVSFGEVEWVELDGMVALSAPPAVETVGRYEVEMVIPDKVLVTMDVDGKCSIQWFNNTDTDGVLALDVTNHDATGGDPTGTVYLSLRSRGVNGTFNTQTNLELVLPDDPARPYGIQVELTFTDNGTNYTGVSARVRKGGAWSAPVAHAFTNTIGAIANTTWFNYLVADSTTASGKEAKLARFSQVDLGNPANTMTADALWSTTSGPTGRIYLEPLFGSSSSPWLDPDIKVWPALQAIVDAWQAALITDVYGDLRLMNRHTLTGVGTGSEMVIDVGQKFEDLPWVLNHADQADRLELKYRPVYGVTEYTGWVDEIVLWEAEDIIIVWPGETEVFFSTDYRYAIDPSAIPFVRADDPFADEYHSWDAHRYNNGSGDRIAAHALSFSLRQVTSSTWAITITNTTGQPCHLVDSTGAPHLKVKALYWFDQPFEETIERGVPGTQARHALKIDASNYVQTEADANALADFIWGRVNQRAWRAERVRMLPDYRLDLGDVVALAHARNGITSNALVTRVHLEGTPGRVGQLVDLVLIPPTWEDFDEAWAGSSWNAFDALWSPHTWNDFDRVPTATTEAEIQGAM